MTKCHQTFSPTYKPRCPEFTPCYQVVSGHLGTFLAERDRDRQSLPLHITNEFEAYLRCGIPAYGFLRMTCEGCDQEKVVAFSCKLFAKVHCVVIHEMRRHYESKAKLAGIKSPKSGCVAFTQRAGSALNLNPHLHVLMVDGVFVDVGGNPLFRNLSAMTDAEVASLAESISKKVLAVLVRAELLNKEGEVVTNPDCDEMFRNHEGLAAASSASISGKIAFGPNAWDPLAEAIWLPPLGC